MKPRLLFAATALVVALVLAVGPAGAQDQKPDAPKQPTPEDYAKYGTPGPEHKRLEPFAGSWTYTVKAWMDPSKPPEESKGTCERKWILDGRFLLEEVQGAETNNPFRGLGLLGYDISQKKYTSAWVDSMSTAIATGLGTCDPSGKVFTFTSEGFDPIAGKRVKGRDLVRIVDNDKHTMEMYKEGPAGKEVKVLEITMTRKQK